jgi:hypothetical protein
MVVIHKKVLRIKPGEYPGLVIISVPELNLQVG